MLPASLKRFFWDQDFGLLRWPEDMNPVARRLLATGDGPALAWLRGKAGDDRLRDLIRATRGRDLDARRLRYWQIVLDLPAAEVDVWLADPARRVWEERVSRDPLLREAEPLGDTGAGVASVDDLSAMKLAAVAQRGTRRDFVDVHALAARRPLADLLDLYRRKYAVTDTTHVLCGLSYFDDAEAERMPDMLAPADWAAIKRDIRAWIKALA